MTRRTEQELLAEYDRRLVLFETLNNSTRHLFEDLYEKYPEADPILIARKGRDERPLSQSLRGLNMAINDCIEGLEDYTAEELERLDTHLKEAGCETVADLLKNNKKIIRSILKQNKINSDTEYYLVAEKVGQMDSDLNEKDRQRLSLILADFEAQYGSG